MLQTVPVMLESLGRRAGVSRLVTMQWAEHEALEGCGEHWASRATGRRAACRLERADAIPGL